MAATVREATLDVLRDCGLTRLFANPGSTEIAFLADLPDDLEFVLALHEGSVVGLATGHAIATGTPALAVLHTTAGLGNAVGALATARVNRAPLVVIVGQQDRRHLALEPFLAGHLDRLAGPYPVWVHQPALPQDVPAAVRRAHHEAVTRRGPALVVVPMDDWAAPTGPGLGLAAPIRMSRGTPQDPEAAGRVAAWIAAARSPALVVGAGADHPQTWTALVRLAERLGCPVWQEPFGARAGFPQNHPRFAGHLPAARGRLRAALDPHDLVIVVGTGAFRQYPFEPGPLVRPGTRVVVVGDDPDDLHHSAADLAVLADPADWCHQVLGRLLEGSDAAPRRGDVDAAPRPGDVDAASRHGDADAAPRPQALVPPTLDAPGPGEPLRAGHVFTELARLLPVDAVVVEETPSSRPDLHRMLPARAPRGFVSAAMGGLGFGLPAAAGLRMGDPSRPVVAVLGDGSALYGIQGLWSAAHYGLGVLFVVLANGRYAVMDRLADQAGGKAPWPPFEEVDLAGLATALGCPARRVETHADLVEELGRVVPGLVDRDRPLLLEVVVTPDVHFAP